MVYNKLNMMQRFFLGARNPTAKEFIVAAL